MMTTRFRRWPTYTIQHRSNYRCGLTMGAYHEESTSDAWLSIWIWGNPKYLAERDAIFRLADEGGFDEPWERDTKGWDVLAASRRLVDFGGHEAAGRWLIERLDELNGARVFALIEGFTGHTSGEEGDEDG